MNFLRKLFISLMICSFIVACSDEGSSSDSEAKDDHVWKEQTDTIDKAKEVEGILMESAEDKLNMTE